MEAVIKTTELRQAIIEQYQTVCSPEKAEQIKKITNKLSGLMAKEISENSPEKSGDYAKSWTYKRAATGGDYSFESVVYNKDKYMLTQLLEKDHPTGLYGYFKGKPHIAPAEEKYTDMYVRQIAEILSR